MGVNQINLRSALRVLVIFSISVLLLGCGWIITIYHYDTFLLAFTHDIYKSEIFNELLSNRKVHYCFLLLKGGIYLLIATWFFFLIRAVIYKKPLLGKWPERWIDGAINIIAKNYSFFKSLPGVVKVTLTGILVIETLSLAYFSATLPYDYDEAFSYLFFSGVGILSSWFFYPLPNNHVLYNILSSVALHLPLPVVPATRVVSLVAAIIATWYFFKLMTKCVGKVSAAMATALLVFSYPFLLYAVQARGYMLLLLCALLCVYSCVNIIGGKSRRKYYALFILSSVAGFFTIPSFLYCFLPVTVILFLNAVRLKSYREIKSTVIANLAIVMGTLALYTPIIWRNGFHALTSNNGVVARGADYIKDNIGSHLQETWNLLTGYLGINIYFWVLLVVLLFTSFFKRGNYNKSLYIISGLMLASPPLIIWLHGVIPFGRTWFYLLLPMYTAVALVISLAADNDKWARKMQVLKPKLLLPVVLLLLTATQLWRFEKLHKRIYGIDYVCESYNQVLKERYYDIKSVGYGEGDFSFYLKDILLSDLKIFDKERKIPFVPLKDGDTIHHDLLILDKKTDFPVSVQDYHLMNPEDSFFKVYLKNDIYDRK
ncbi:MAG: glycosyltransferase family 39 protein [Bacteroidetes bacterium]|nr:glycosyltransferase family 39 protein [Bacteroidota bacterium]